MQDCNPVPQGRQIETSLTESLQAYLNGQASVEEAMDAVEGSLKMYLAE